MADKIRYVDFLALIERIVEGRESGSLFARTDANNSVVVSVQDGKIVTLTAGPKRGIDAVERIAKMTSCTVRRTDTVLNYHSGDLPPTPELLRILREAGRGRPLAAAPDDIDNRAEGGVSEPEKAGKVLCEILHDYLGPVAPMICDEITDNGALLRTARDIDAVIEQLALEIDSPAEAQEFRTRAQQRLSPLPS